MHELGGGKRRGTLPLQNPFEKHSLGRDAIEQAGYRAIGGILRTTQLENAHREQSIKK